MSDILALQDVLGFVLVIFLLRFFQLSLLASSIALVGSLVLGWTVRPVVRWYDAWLGFYWDRGRRELFIFAFPFVGLGLRFTRRKRPARYRYTGSAFPPEHYNCRCLDLERVDS